MRNNPAVLLALRWHWITDGVGSEANGSNSFSLCDKSQYSYTYM